MTIEFPSLPEVEAHQPPTRDAAVAVVELIDVEAATALYQPLDASGFGRH
jgi:hypothetical protein